MPRNNSMRSGVQIAIACGLFLVLLTLLGMAGKLPKWLPACYLVMSPFTFMAYWLDKRRAGEVGVRRIPERRLLTFDAIFGWPGGLAAQHYWRHKNRKSAYQWKFWAIAVAHLVGLVFVSLY